METAMATPETPVLLSAPSSHSPDLSSSQPTGPQSADDRSPKLDNQGAAARRRKAHNDAIRQPFSCNLCSEGFESVDILLRHAANHTSGFESPLGKRQRATRVRVAQACQPCAAAKVKCDEEEVCRRCQKKNIPCRNAATKPDRTRVPEPEQRADSLPSALSVEPAQSALASSMPSVSRWAPEIPLAQTPDARMNGTLGFTTNTIGTLDNDISQVSNDFPFIDMLKNLLTDSNSLPSDLLTSLEAGSSTPQHFARIAAGSGLDIDDIDWGLWEDQLSVEKAEPEPTPLQGVYIKSLVGEQAFPTGAAAFKRSLWQWYPEMDDYRVAEQHDLSLPSATIGRLEALGQRDFKYTAERLYQENRDMMLATILSVCEPSNIPRVVASFPSAMSLEKLMRVFFTSHVSQPDTWIHIPSFRVRETPVELVMAVIAAGAITTPIRAVQKLGLAIQEVLRAVIGRDWDTDNSLTRHLQLLQAYALQLQIGLWSGDNRRMEIAEGFQHIIFNMLRRANRFRWSSYPRIIPDPEDEGEQLEAKWRMWIEAESFKRLVYHLFVQDIQTSLMLSSGPSISYSELTLPLPEARQLWFAQSAAEWKQIYLAIETDRGDSCPSLTECLADPAKCSKMPAWCDSEHAKGMYLHGLWPLVHEYRISLSIFVTQDISKAGDKILIYESQHQRLLQVLNDFRLDDGSDSGEGSLMRSVILELLLMHLWVSFEDIQIVAGKAGEEEAKKAYPALKRWMQDRKGRQALWQAGQVLRAVRRLPADSLKGFYVVAAYHASLFLWVYGILSRTDGEGKSVDMGQESAGVLLDGEENVDVRKWISLNQGLPWIRGGWCGRDAMQKKAPLQQPGAVMETVLELLMGKFTGANDELPPLVENVGHLMRELESAAQVTRFG